MQHNSLTLIKKYARVTMFSLAVAIFILSGYRIYAIINLQHHLTDTLTPRKIQAQSTKGLEQLHLFGISERTQNLPIANIPLILQGISYITQHAANNTAIIGTNNSNRAKMYHAGDELPFGAKIQTILPNQVNIYHNGQLERLILPTHTLQENHNAS